MNTCTETINRRQREIYKEREKEKKNRYGSITGGVSNNSVIYINNNNNNNNLNNSNNSNTNINISARSSVRVSCAELVLALTLSFRDHLRDNKLFVGAFLRELIKSLSIFLPHLHWEYECDVCNY